MEKLDAKVAYPAFDGMTIAEHLAGMVRFATIANHDESLVDKTQFDGLHKYLEETYPLTHAKLEKQIIGKRTLFYRWAGNGKSGKKPLLFMAHQDVVPVTCRRHLLFDLYCRRFPCAYIFAASVGLAYPCAIRSLMAVLS